MKPNWLICAALWAFRATTPAFSGDAVFNDAVQASLGVRPPRPERDPINRYFLPGTSRLLSVPATPLANADEAEDFREGLFNPRDDKELRHSVDLLALMRKQDAREDAFSELDLRSDWERERLRGRVKRRNDFFPGGVLMQSQVDYDSAGRRTHETLYDPTRNVVFSRRYQYQGAGATPLVIESVDLNGVTRNATAFTLNAQGLPLEEEQTDSAGIPVLHRSYRYDKQGCLTSFQENPRVSLRGLKMTFAYEANGRLFKRRVKGPDGPSPTWITEFDPDYGRPGFRERRELLGWLPLGNRPRFGSGFETRRVFKYRVHFEDADNLLYLKAAGNAGNDVFFFEKLSLLFTPQGFLKEAQNYNKESLPLEREFWTWDAQYQLSRYEIWNRPGQDNSSESWSYQYDARGNWTRRQSFGNPDAEERAFEYYRD